MTTTPWYRQTSKDVLQQLGSSTDGLAKDEVDALRERYGPNKLEEGKKKSKLVLFASQFKDAMIGILMVAAAVSFLVGEHTDAYVILGIILGNALIGYFQENKAEESIQQLQQLRGGDNPGKVENKLTCISVAAL